MIVEELHFGESVLQKYFERMLQDTFLFEALLKLLAPRETYRRKVLTALIENCKVNNEPFHWANAIEE